MSGLYGASIPRYMIGMSGSSSRSVSARLTIPDLLGEIERLLQVHQRNVSRSPSHAEARVPREKPRTAPMAVA